MAAVKWSLGSKAAFIGVHGLQASGRHRLQRSFIQVLKSLHLFYFHFEPLKGELCIKMTLIPKQSNKNFVKPLELKITVCTWVTHSLFVHKQWMWIVNLRQNYVFIQDTAYRNNYYFSLGTVFMVFIQVFFPTATLIAHKYYLFSPCNNFVKL